MACVPHLLAAALAAAAPAASAAPSMGETADVGTCARSIYTSPLPACDELGLADEEGEVAARDLLREGEPLTPAGGFDERDCRMGDKAPAIVDCNDSRASQWVHEMIGTCDMPKVHLRTGGHVLPLRDRGHGPSPSGFCAGASCSSDSIPLRPLSRAMGDSPWLLLDGAALRPVPPMVRLVATSDLAPDDVTRPPLLRPPIV